MENLKPNDVLVNRDGDEFLVLAVHEGSVWITNQKRHFSLTIDNLSKNSWTKKKTPWVPEERKRYFTADITMPKLFIENIWYNDKVEHHRLALELAFETEEEAVARAKEIIGLMGK